MSKQTVFKKYEVLGVQIDSLTIAEATDYIAAQASKGPAMYVTKPHVEFIDRAVSDPSLRRVLNAAELCLPDGVALNWATTYLYGGRHNLPRWFATLAGIVLKPASLYRYLPDRFAGVNATWPLLERCVRDRLKVFLVGSPKQGSIHDTAASIRKRLPTIRIVGTYPGELGGLRNEALTAALSDPRRSPEKELASIIEQAQPDVILIGLGFPIQELLMARLVKRLTHGVLVGEGGSFDYVSFGGSRRRAPKLLQKIGLEWFWRLLLEPSRLKRQTAIPRFMSQVYREGRQLDKT